MRWWSAVTDRVGEVRYEKTISFGNWVSILATFGSAMATIAIGIWFASAFVVNIHDQLAAGQAQTDLRIAEINRMIADMKSAEQERTTDLLNRLSEEARLRERLDGRLDNLLRQRRGDVGAAPDGQQFP